MKRSAEIVAVLVCAILFLSQPARAGDPDLSTPKAAAKTMLNAVDAGDFQAARAAAVVPAEDEKVLQALVNYGGGFRKLSEAVEAKFGKEAAGQFPRLSQRAATLDGATEKVTGDTATISSGDGDDINLKKIDGQWKVDIFSDPKFPGATEAIHDLSGTAAAAGKTADNVKSGTYKTLDEVQQAFVANMEAAMAPTTMPSGGATTLPG